MAAEIQTQKPFFTDTFNSFADLKAAYNDP